MFPLPGYGGLSPIPAYVPICMGQGRAEDLMDFRMHKALESQYGVNYASDPMATVAWHGGWGQAGPTVADTLRNQWMGMQNPTSRAGMRGMYPGGYF